MGNRLWTDEQYSTLGEDEKKLLDALGLLARGRNGVSPARVASHLGISEKEVDDIVSSLAQKGIMLMQGV